MNRLPLTNLYSVNDYHEILKKMLIFSCEYVTIIFNCYYELRFGVIKEMTSLSETKVNVGNAHLVRDMSAYFFGRIIVTGFLLLGYYYTIQKDIDFVEFFITSLLLFTPFILDYYPRQHDDKFEQWLRKFGMMIPLLAIIGILVAGIIHGDASYWASSTPKWLKKLCMGGGVLIVALAFLDYNNYTRRDKRTQDMKLHSTEYIEESKSEAVGERIKRNEAQKKEGLKKLALENEKKPKKKSPRK